MIRALLGVAAYVALTGCRGDGPARHRDDGGAPPMTRAVVRDGEFARMVEDDLRRSGSAAASDLVAGAPPRRIVTGAPMTLPHSGGRTRFAPIALSPGPPALLPVPTQIEYLRYVVSLDDAGAIVVTGRPDRADLVAGVRAALDGEARAVDAATRAMTDAGVALPAGFASWRAAIRQVTYDSRLPSAGFGGMPAGWSFIFEPWNDAGGWNQVLLDADFRVTMVNGRPP